MAMDGISSPSAGASADSDGVEVVLADFVPLGGPQKGFSRRERASKKPSSATPAGGAGPPEGGGNRRIGRGLPEGQRDRGASEPRKRGTFPSGDLVWAKAFPYTWWPGWVRETKGAARLVSLFGSGSSRWLVESRVRGFEENFARLSKMGGAKLACQVDCALAELGRRTALAMAGSCRGVAGTEDGSLIMQIARERERFEPAEMLGFVLNLAVFAWVDEGQTIAAVRVAAQVNAYRSHVRATRRVEVSGGFQPEEALDAIRGLAVSARMHDEAAAETARVVAQLDAYRDFLAVRLDCFYRGPAESDGSTSCSASEDSEGVMSADESDGLTSCTASGDSEGTDLEMPFISVLETEEVTDPDYLYENEAEEQDEEDDRMQGKVRQDGELCIVNTIDYSIFSSDTESEHLSDNEMQNSHSWNGEKGVAFENNTSNDPSRYASCVHGFHGKEFVQNLPLSPCVEMYKSVDFSIGDASTSYPLESTTESGSKLFTDFSLKHQGSMVSGKFHDEEGFLQILQGMLYCLYCLACDPLQMKSKNLSPCLQLLLSYRASIFQNISSFSSTIWAEETLKDQEHDTWECQHLENENEQKHRDDGRANMCEHSGVARVLFCSHDDRMELSSSAECHSNMHMPHATRDSISICSSADISSASKTEEKKSTADVEFQCKSEKKLSGKIIIDRRYLACSDGVARGVSHLTSPVSHDSRRRRFYQEVTSVTSSNLHATNSLGSDAKESKISMMLLDNMRSNDSKSFYVKKSDMNDREEISFLDVFNCTTIQSNSNFFTTANTSGFDTTKDVVACCSAFSSTCGYESSSHGKWRHDRPVKCYTSKWHKNALFSSETRLYASPLVRNSPSATSSAQCSPTARRSRIDGPSNSLHMKFPRGFNLPSKEDLGKIFSVFGPLDHSRTRVFFYTGAGKVVFLNPVDAETAYNYVRRNRLFEADMRFWLDAYEKAREDHSPALSLSGGQMPALSLKSCLKRCSLHQNEDTRKKCKVRFSL
ncbi:hypothetical protein Taro_038568 [Colocasia esculenta]|uniref:PWWP domain-containing protein n=1 Tax=Colocasia esculenta TaxID=4460 RepID=A0A843WML6_COLES|nr:hypothetical protein [Colocasia esculenta]